MSTSWDSNKRKEALFRKLIGDHKAEEERERQLAEERRRYKADAVRAANEQFEQRMRDERAKQRARGIAVAKAACAQAIETNPYLMYSLPYDMDLLKVATADDDGLPTNFNMNSLEYREWTDSGREYKWRKEHDFLREDVVARHKGFKSHKDKVETLARWEREYPEMFLG